VSDRGAADEALMSISSVVRDFCDRHDPAGAARRRTDERDAFPRSVWTRAARELDIAAVGLPTELGGAGLGVRGLSAVLEAAGRTLSLPPLLPTVVMAATLISALPQTELSAQTLASIVDGSSLAAVVLGAGGAPYAARPMVEVTAAGADHRLDGSVSHSIGAAEADTLVVVAELGDAIAVLGIGRQQPGVVVSPLQALDFTRPVAAVAFREARAKLLGLMDRSSYLQVMAGIVAAWTCEQIGAADRVVERTVKYATERIQFGRPIGSFQAVKHRCVDMVVELEAARSLAYDARDAADDGRADANTASSAARVRTAEAGLTIARSSLHIFGGLGFSWEDDAHLYLRRAKSAEQYFGCVDAHLEYLVDRLIADRATR
jgi:alkylation response protein AidB-like acyl-CoA dehydrogenase